MNINYDDDFIFYNDNYDKEDLVDITDSKTEEENISHVSNDKSSGGYKHGRRNTKPLIIACCVAGVVLLGTSIAGVAIMNQPEKKEVVEQKQNFTYPEGTVVSGISLAGKTYEEALKLLNSKKEYFINPVTIAVNANGNKYTLTQDNFEYDLNTEEILKELKKQEENSVITDSTASYEVIATCKKESIKKQVENIKKQADKKPVNARVSEFKPYGDNDRFKYEEEKLGYEIEANDLESQITTAVNGKTPAVEITAKSQETKPAITMDMVKKNIVHLATYETIPMSTASAIDNMKTALDACSGSIIEPGKTWSFSGSAGDTNLESNGYKPAGVIVNGEMTQGIGGGVCQASSTLYNAGIRANMEIVERHCHTFASDYVPTGLDSTIAYPVLDLKMKNTTDYQMFLECKMVEGNKLTVTFWGYKDPSYDEIKVANEISDVEDGEFSARAWRVYYKDGKEIKREELGSSQYEASGGRGGGSAEGVTGLINSNNSSSSQSNSNNSSSSQSNSNNSSQSDSNNSSSGQVRPPSHDVPDPTEPPTEAPQPTEPPAESEPSEPEENDPVDEPTDSEPGGEGEDTQTQEDA